MHIDHSTYQTDIPVLENDSARYLELRQETSVSIQSPKKLASKELDKFFKFSLILMYYLILSRSLSIF
jgi:hypothetical protein